MASPSSWSTSSASSDDSALTFFSQASSALTQSGLPPVWFDDNRQRNVSFLIHYTDDLEGIVEGVVANSPVQNFDLMDFALTHNFLSDDETQFVERINLYDPRGRHDDPPLNPLQSWAQNGVNGGDTLTFVPIFKKVELHFKIVFADVKMTRVVVVEITDCFLDVLYELYQISPEMDYDDLRFDWLKIYYQSNLVNDKPCCAIHEIIDHEKSKPFYNFEVQICGRGGGGGVKRKAVAVSEMREQPNDPPNIKSVFNIQAFVSKAWLKSLSDEEAEAYNKELKNVKGMPHQIECTLNRIKEYAELKVGLKTKFKTPRLEVFRRPT